MSASWLKIRIRKFMKLSIKQYLYIAIIIYIAGILTYLTVSYISEKNNVNKNINNQLIKAAQSLDYLLPMNYHDRAINRTSISDIEFNEILQLLTYHANNYNVKYIYSVVNQNGKLYITSSSATSHEIRTGQNLSYYWQEYSEADKKFYEAFNTNLITYVEYTDRWGTFRTVIIPKLSLTGRKYLECADIDIGYIDSLIWKNLLFVFLKALFFTLIILPLFHVLYKYYRKATFSFKAELNRKELKVTQEEELRKQSIQKLKQVDEKFQALFYNSPLPMIIISQNGKVIDSNKSCQDFLGTGKFDLNDHIIFTIPFFASVNEYEKLTTKLETNKILEGESIVLSTKKGNIPCKIWGSLLESIQKHQYIFIIQDMTNELTFLRELEEAKKIAEDISSRKSSFIANISHEIRTPLNAIIGFTDLLKEDISDEHLKNEYIEIISSNSKNLLLLMNDMIDFSKIEAGQLKITEVPCNLNQLFNRLEIWAKEEIKQRKIEGVTIIKKIAFDDNNSVILTDEARLNQVILNLLTNSMKFTQKGTIEFGYKLQNNKILFFVKDSGLGMDKKDIEVIFERFGQGKEGQKIKYGGSGLGLSISKKIIDLMGGDMWVESEINKGTSFYFTIKYQRFDLIKTNNTNKVNDFSSLRFIVADSDVATKEFLTRSFEKLNIQYQFASDINELIENIENNQDINIVLLDLSVELSNISELISYIKSKKNIKLIATSTNQYLINIHKSNNLGFDALLLKPYTRKDLEDILIEFISFS